MKIPEGWKLVPVEPTEEMKGAGGEAYSFNVENIYAAMLAAAPVPPQADAQPVGRVSYIGNGFVRVRLTGASPKLESPLYTHADAGELERLREEAQKLNISHEGSNALAASLQKQNETLHAQLAKRDALLREVVALDPRGEFMGWDLDGRIDAALSASAEPGDDRP